MDVIDDGIASAAEQMRRDALLIANVQTLQRPLLRFYRWQGPSVTYGCFIQPGQYLHLPMRGVDLAKRPTGGGILFHWCDFSFTVAVPCSHPRFSNNTLENYYWINQAVLEAIAGIQPNLDLVGKKDVFASAWSRFCMATPTQYDIILLDGRKIGGSAQRKTRYGYIHQSSIFLTPPPWEEIGALLKQEKEPEDAKTLVGAMQKMSGALLAPTSSAREIESIRQLIQERIAVTIKGVAQPNKM